METNLRRVRTIIKFESDKATIFPYLYAQPRWVIQQYMEEDEEKAFELGDLSVDNFADDQP